MRKGQLGTKGWGLAIPLAMSLLINITARASDEENLNELAEEPTITVRVFNYTRLSDKALTEAGAQTSRVFWRAGIKVLWLNCYSSKEGFQSHPHCGRASGPTDISLRVLYRPKVMPSSFHDTIGFSFVASTGEFGDLGSVYYDRVEDMAVRFRITEAVVLGHAAAHEIGHLLLGTARHSRKGIMCANWSRGEMILAVLGDLRFTRQEAQLLRAAVLNRERAQYAPQPVQSATPWLAAFSTKRF